MATEDQRRALVVALVSVLTGLLLLGAGAFEVYGNAGTDWETAEGTVLSGEVEHRFNPFGKAREMNEYWPIVRYEFRVLGERYEGDRTHAGFDADFYYVRDFAEATLQEYPVGSEVQVYYDPNDPSVSALQVDPGAGGVLIALGALVMFGGVYLSRKMSGLGSA